MTAHRRPPGPSTAGQRSSLTDAEEKIAWAFADALRRAEAEYIEMPGLRLTVAQASRLWHCDSALCSAVLSKLVEQRFLVRTRNESFSRA
jgi:hypothetical protein